MAKAVVVISAAGSLLASIFMVLGIYRMSEIRERAYTGDANAAKWIVLPCFGPLFVFIVGVFLVCGIGQLVACFLLASSASYYIVQFYFMCLLILMSVPQVLLLQPSVSIMGFKRTTRCCIAYALCCLVSWILTIVSNGDTLIAFQAIFLCITFIPSVSSSILMLSKGIFSRIQTGSASNRSSSEFVLAYSILYGFFNVMSIIHSSSSIQDYTYWAIVVYTIAFGVQFYPLALYRTLLADTKYWRGLGQHNKGGIRFSEAQLEGEVSSPMEMELQVMAGDLQDMISVVGDQVVDFAFLKIGSKIGDGATAEVYSGLYIKEKVAIKISSPPEVTAEVIGVFASEASISASLSHENIVKFHGICIRPPQISMVMELCKRGNLKDSLTKCASDWTTIRRVSGCLGAAKALEYLHAQCLIHRDVKAANFFVSDDWTVKLGDFGESTGMRFPEDGGERMSILGTVSHMAPELVAAESFYTEAVDVYAFAMLMWEVWTGLDPYSDVDHFAIYALVGNGDRPPIPKDMPAELQTVMKSAWDQLPHQRPNARTIVELLSHYLIDLLRADGNGHLEAIEEILQHLEPDYMKPRSSIQSFKQMAKSAKQSVKQRVLGSFSTTKKLPESDNPLHSPV